MHLQAPVGQNASCWSSKIEPKLAMRAQRTGLVAWSVPSTASPGRVLVGTRPVSCPPGQVFVPVPHVLLQTTERPIGKLVLASCGLVPVQARLYGWTTPASSTFKTSCQSRNL